MRIFILASTIYMLSSLNLVADDNTDSLETVNLQTVEVISTPKEKGELSIQPLASTSVGALKEQHINSLKDISTRIPNLFIPNYGSRITSAVYIRGVGSRSGTPAVAMYVDNVPYSDKSAFDFNFFDIERIDVLRGPQATLYGRNAMGGIIKVHTKNPFRYQGTDFRFGYNTGNDQRTISLTHYHRITNRHAFSAGLYAEGASGYYNNSTTGNDVDRLHSAGGRIRSILLPRHDLRLDLSINYDYNYQSAYPYFYLGTTPENKEEYPKLIGQISNNRESTYLRSLLNLGANIEYQGNGWKFTSITGYQHLRDRMFLDQDFLRADIYSLEQRQWLHSFSQEVIVRSTNTKKWQWLFGASLMGQTLHTSGPVTFYEDGLRWLESNINTNMPPINRIPLLMAMGFEGMSVNFRGNQLCMAGEYSTPTFSSALFHQSDISLCKKLTLTAGLRLEYENQRIRYNSPAHVDYSFRIPNSGNPKMAVDLSDLALDVLYKGFLRRNYIHLLPKLSLQYTFNKNNNIYISATIGQRAGGYNLQMFSDLIQGAMRTEMMESIQKGIGQYLQTLDEEAHKGNNSFPLYYYPDDKNPEIKYPFYQYVQELIEAKMPKSQRPTTDQVIYKPEHSWNYEIGAHLCPTPQLQFQTALFMNIIYNQQLSRFASSGLGRMMVNAGRSISWGGEISAQYQPNAHLSITANYGYTHAIFQHYNIGADRDYKGNYVPFVPRHTLCAEWMYTFFLNGNHVKTLSLGLNTSGFGRIFWTEDNLYTQYFKAQLGARILLKTPWGNLSFWARNLTNNKYHSFFFISAKRQYAQYDTPRQVGIDINIKF